MTYTYKRTEPSLWTVGEHTPSGAWEPESDHGSPEEAAARVRYLNGGPEPQAIAAAEVIHQLNAIDAAGDPETAHGKADQLLLQLVPAEVAAAYGRVVARASWWAAA